MKFRDYILTENELSPDENGVKDYERHAGGLLVTLFNGKTIFFQAGDEANQMEDKLEAAKDQEQMNMIIDDYIHMAQ